MAGVGAPGAGRVEIDVELPVPTGFGVGGKPVADEGEIVVGVGVGGIEVDGGAQVLAGGFQLAELFEDAAEVEVGDGAAGVYGDRALKGVDGVFQVALLVGEHAEIYEGIDMAGTGGEDVAVGIDGLGAGFGFGFVLAGEGKPVFGISLGHEADFVVELAGVEVEDELAGNGLEAGAVALDDDVAAVGQDAELGEGGLDFGEFLVEGDEGAAKAVGGDAFFDELLGGAKADQIAEVVELAGTALAGRDEAKLFPIGELLISDVQDALEFAPGESLGCAHVPLAC